MKTNAEYLKAHKARMKAAGYKRFEWWLLPADAERVRRFIAELKKKKQK